MVQTRKQVRIVLCILGLICLVDVLLAAPVPELRRPAPISTNSTKGYTFLPTLVRQVVSNPFDIERYNATIILEKLQLDNVPRTGPLMYCRSDLPFDPNCSGENSVRAYDAIRSNDDGRGDGSCQSRGSGVSTNGQLDPYHFNFRLNQTVDFVTIRANLTGLRLSKFWHINVVDASRPWNTSGEAGDSRVYVNGTFELRDGNKELLKAVNVKWYQNISYPAPIGSAGSTKVSENNIAAYFVGQIDELGSDEEWVEALDPYNTGYMLGVVQASAFGSNDCYRVASFWVSLRAFPDLARGTFSSIFIQQNTADTGAKVGPYFGSKRESVERAVSYANATTNVGVITVGSISVASVAVTSVLVVVPAAASASASVAMPGGGATRMVRNAAFIARLGQIRGFHTDSFTAFGKKLDIFLLKVPFPFGSSSGELSTRKLVRHGRPEKRNNQKQGLRQNDEGNGNAEDDDDDDDGDGDGDNDEDEEEELTDEVFKGCAFYSMIITGGVLALHALLWLATRNKPMEEKVTPHAWMMFIFTFAMEYVHSSSILNAFQYFRLHLGQGTGKLPLYLIAFSQLFFIGVGFLMFLVIVIALAERRLRNHDVTWIPRTKHPDPEIRKSTVVAGEYQADDNNFFHGVFEGYYSGLAGPKIWLVVIEAIVGVVDTIVTAIVWDELIVLSILVCLYSLLLLLFIIFNPFVDTIEGRLVNFLGFADLVILFLEFLSALGNYETAEELDSLAVSVATISMIIGVLITIYCDAIPISLTVWEWVSKWVFAAFRKVGLLVSVHGDSSLSGWSAFTQSSDSKSSSRSSSSFLGQRVVGSDDVEVEIEGMDDDGFRDRDRDRDRDGPRATISRTREVEEDDDGDEEERQERFFIPLSIPTSLWRRRSVRAWRQTSSHEDEIECIQPAHDGQEWPARFVRDDEAIAELPQYDMHQRIESFWDLRNRNNDDDDDSHED